MSLGRPAPWNRHSCRGSRNCTAGTAQLVCEKNALVTRSVEHAAERRKASPASAGANATHPRRSYPPARVAAISFPHVGGISRGFIRRAVLSSSGTIFAAWQRIACEKETEPCV